MSNFSANDFVKVVQTSFKHGADDMLSHVLGDLTDDELLFLERVARELYDWRVEQNEEETG